MENTESNRQRYRELLYKTEGLGDYISGAIMYEETLFQKATCGTPMVDLLKKNKIIPGIKVDLGVRPLYVVFKRENFKHIALILRTTRMALSCTL